MKRRQGRLARNLVGFLLGLVGLLGATALLKAFGFEQYLYNVALVYIIIVLLVASQYGLWPGLSISLVGFLCLNYFFIPPYHTFDIDSPAGVVAVIGFLVAATITSQIAAYARQKRQEALLRQQETATLNAVNMAVLGEVQVSSMLARVVEQVAESVQAKAAILYLPQENAPKSTRPNGSILKIEATVGEEALLQALFSFRVGEQTFQKKEAIFQEVKLTASDHAWDAPGWLAYLPLLRSGEALGVMALLVESPPAGQRWPFFNKQNPYQPEVNIRQWLSIVANQAALAVYHARLIAQSAHLASLEEADRLKSALLALVSHELRTPLTTIKTAVEGLLDTDVDLAPEEQRDYLGAINQETDRLNRLISNMLNLSRIEAGKLKPQKGLYYLPEIVTKTVNRLKRNPIVAAHPVQTEFEEELPLVPVDYLQLEQVLTNLLENAGKYSPPGTTILIKVSQGAKPGGPAVTENPALKPAQTIPGLKVEVMDEGPGIAESEMSRIFDKFYQVGGNQPKTNISGNPEGSGLGLAVCKGIIEAHGGQLWVYNRVPKGSAFAFWLPAK